MFYPRNVAGLMLSLLFVFAAHVAIAADDPETPKTLKGGTIATADEVKSMLGKAGIFDMRKPISFGKGHLQGAMALPYDQKSDKTEAFDAAQDKFDMSKLPPDKNAAVVFYSDGPTGWKSYKAAVVSIKAGYTKVYWFRGGSQEWESKGFPLVQ